MKGVGMRPSVRKTIIIDWIVLITYYMLIISTLYVFPKLWDFCISVFGTPFHLVADLAVFVIFFIFFVAVVYDDIFHKSVKDLIRYAWLIILGWAMLITLKRMPFLMEEVCIPEYALVCYISFRVVYHYVKTRALYPILFLIVVGFACLEEGLQFFIPTRFFNPMDIVKDVWGGILIVLVINLVIQPEFKSGVIEKTIRRIVKRTKFSTEDILVNIRDFWFDLGTKINDFLFF